MRKLQGYQHHFVYKTCFYPNNASYDLKTVWIKIDIIKTSQFKRFLNTFFQLLPKVEKGVFFH